MSVGPTVDSRTYVSILLPSDLSNDAKGAATLKILAEVAPSES